MFWMEKCIWKTQKRKNGLDLMIKLLHLFINTELPDLVEHHQITHIQLKNIVNIPFILIKNQMCPGIEHVKDVE